MKESAKLSKYVQKPDDLLFLKPAVVMLFGGMIVVAGAVCALVSRDFLLNGDSRFKALFYFLLGASTAFAAIFVVFDLLNCIALVCNSMFSGPVVDCSGQIYLLAATACLIGAFFSLKLGTLRSSVQEFSLTLEEHREDWKVVGVALGVASGVINECMLRSDGLNICLLYTSDAADE
eukprot:TRINITY_DN13543_c0_g3_i1.p1 TRINITY_DN13543_c0_g3~~TRINITY_DN13543_c0_g3_i1.p1  ORF type:complete len:177 (+),score=52.74 TRINITY_DN13543_c0_g3_i1:266-796(+)